jgi:hypothetical protein
LAIVTNVGAGCGGRGSAGARGESQGGSFDLVSDVSHAHDERHWSRTAKPCGPGTRCWCQAGGGALIPTGIGCARFAGDGDKTNSSPRRARNKPLKPLRRECRGCSGEPVVYLLACFTFYTRGRGCNGHPAFPAPSLEGRPRPLLFGRKIRSQLGQTMSRDGEGMSALLPATNAKAFAQGSACDEAISRHSGAPKGRTMVRNCAPENLAQQLRDSGSSLRPVRNDERGVGFLRAVRNDGCGLDRVAKPVIGRAFARDHNDGRRSPLYVLTNNRRSLLTIGTIRNNGASASE